MLVAGLSAMTGGVAIGIATLIASKKLSVNSMNTEQYTRLLGEDNAVTGRHLTNAAKNTEIQEMRRAREQRRGGYMLL